MQALVKGDYVQSCPLCCCIRLSGGGVALVDPEDWVSLNRRGWKVKRSKGTAYAYRKMVIRGKSRYIYMHRLLTECPSHLWVHHWNRNGLDDRRANMSNMDPVDHEQLHQMQRISKMLRVPRGDMPNST